MLPVLIACNNGSVDMERPAPIRAVVAIAAIAVLVDINDTIRIKKVIDRFDNVVRGIFVHIDGQRAICFLLGCNIVDIVESVVNHEPIYAEFIIGDGNVAIGVIFYKNPIPNFVKS